MKSLSYSKYNSNKSLLLSLIGYIFLEGNKYNNLIATLFSY